MRPEIPPEAVTLADRTMVGYTVSTTKLGQSPEDQSEGPDQVTASSSLTAGSHRI